MTPIGKFGRVAFGDSCRNRCPDHHHCHQVLRLPTQQHLVSSGLVRCHWSRGSFALAAAQLPFQLINCREFVELPHWLPHSLVAASLSGEMTTATADP